MSMFLYHSNHNNDNDYKFKLGKPSAFTTFVMACEGLIDFSSISNGMISGLENDEIQEIIDVQALCKDNFLNSDFHCDTSIANCNRIDEEIISKTLSTSAACISIPPEISKRIDEIEKSATAKSSAEQMTRYSQKFLSFLSNKGFSTNLLSYEPDDLAKALRYFYSELKTNKGTLYSPSTLVCIRAALHRYFISSDIRLKVNILEDREFHAANQVLTGMIRQFMEEGGETKQFDSIEESDLEKMRNYFDRSSPRKLQEEAYFCIEYYFGTRGREWLRYLRKGSVKIRTDSNGKEYVEILNIHNIQKNVQPNIQKSKRENLKQARMYSLLNKDECPVECLKLLLGKLPQESEHLFYKSTHDYRTTGVWYNVKQPLGVNTISKFMKNISQNAELSRIYTAHCIRPTVVTTMWNSGCSVQDIQNVTGQKKEDSVKRYLKRVGDDKKKEYSRVLSNSFNKGKEEDNNQQTTPLNRKRKLDDFQKMFKDCQFNNCSFNFN